MDDRDQRTLKDHTDRILTLSGQCVALDVLLRGIITSIAATQDDPLAWLATKRTELIQSLSAVAAPADIIENTILERAETHLDYIFDNIEVRFPKNT
ncbi:MAG: hypothetical protein ACXWIW_06755 [Croceibacterium sp.]